MPFGVDVDALLTFVFLPSVDQEKLARRVPTVAFCVWSLGPEGRGKTGNSLPP